VVQLIGFGILKWKAIMKRKIASTLLMTLLITSTVAGVERIPVIKDQEERPVVAVWREDWGLGAKDFGPFLITAIWADGKTIWSKDNVQGGAPYYQGKIDPKVLENALRELEIAEVFSASYVRNYFGPDSFCTGIYLSHGNKTFTSRSWHELAEKNPKIVASSSGLTSLGGKTREEFLKGDNKEYLKYRALWERIRVKVNSLLPKEGEEKPLKFEMKDMQPVASPDKK
jgi:hypothetical protein